jgi:RNA polymerase sigma-70 factor (ECF subfamily)
MGGFHLELTQWPAEQRVMGTEPDTLTVQVWIDRLRVGDDSARDALLMRAFDRLRRLARRMLKGYPAVGRWEETDDVLQNAMIRLDRALRSVAPPTARDFFRLAAAQIRRELLDLARRYRGPEGIGVHHDSREGVEVLEVTHDPGRLAEWTEFHQRVESLPDEDREIVDLLWYQGLTQAEAADTLGVSERTVNRRWLAARVRLCDALGGQLPG